MQSEPFNGLMPSFSIPPNNTQLPFPGKLIDKNVCFLNVWISFQRKYILNVSFDFSAFPEKFD